VTVAAARPHTDGVEAALEAAGLLVGRGRQPAGSGWQGQEGASDFLAYVVLYPSPGATDGNVADPHEYLDYSFQTTCVAASQEGAEAVADLVKTALVGQTVTVTGRACYPVYAVADPPVRRDDTVTPPLHISTPVFRFRSQPA
jgi:hypothetical protein